MSYSVDVIRALNFAHQAHLGQVDKAGAKYIDHPMRVADRMDTKEEKVVALLHDVVEDNASVTIEEICSEFGFKTASAVDAITHRKGESWSDYLSRVKKNDMAKKVKIADLIDNSNLSRFNVVEAKDVMRQAKYNRALMFLMEIDGE